MKKVWLGKMKIISMICVLLVTIISTNVVYADDGTQPQTDSSPTVIRQGGPVVVTSPVKPSNVLLAAAAATAYRRGATDAWWVFYPTPLKYEHHGSHTSSSDLVEEKIWVDGSLKVGTAGTVDSCSNHSEGRYANCGTDATYYWKYKIVATSYHVFHKTGYSDTSLTTSKTLTP